MAFEPRAVDVPLLSGTSPLRADAANDRRQDRDTDNRTVVTSPRTVETRHTEVTHERASTSTQPSKVVRDEHDSTHRSDTN